MRIIELSTFHERCGIATYTEALSTALTNLGEPVDVLSPYLEEGGVERGPSPPRLWSRHQASLREAAMTFQAIRQRRAELVHAQVNISLFSPRFLAALGALCRASRIPLVATLHGRDGGSRQRRRIAQRLHLALLPAHLVVHNIRHRAELRRSRVQVIAHGMSPLSIADVREAKRASGIDPDRPVIAHFGFLMPHKGVAEMLEAIAELVRGKYPRLLYRVVGGAAVNSSSYTYLEELRARVRALGIEENVELDADFVPDDRVTARLQSADWVVLNYSADTFEGTSGAARVALAAGRPLCVSTSQVFDDLRDSVYTMRGPLVSELERLLSSDTLSVHTLTRARQFAEQCSWARVAAQHLELFHELRR